MKKIKKLKEIKITLDNIIVELESKIFISKQDNKKNIEEKKPIIQPK